MVELRFLAINYEELISFEIRGLDIILRNGLLVPNKITRITEGGLNGILETFS